MVSASLSAAPFVGPSLSPLGLLQVHMDKDLALVDIPSKGGLLRRLQNHACHGRDPAFSPSCHLPAHGSNGHVVSYGYFAKPSRAWYGYTAYITPILRTGCLQQTKLHQTMTIEAEGGSSEQVCAVV